MNATTQKTSADAASPAHKATVSVRSLGIPVAWIVGTGCGWKMAEQTDLLRAVGHGAAAWLATLIVWTAGAQLWEGALGSKHSVHSVHSDDKRAAPAEGAAAPRGQSGRAAQS